MQNETTSNKLPHFKLSRVRAALDLRRSSVEQIARDAAVSPRHVWYVVNNQRKPSDRLLAVIRAAVGPSGWDFATGQTDCLNDREVDHVA